MKLNLTFFKSVPIGIENANQSLLVWPVICLQYSLLKKSGPPVIKLSKQCCDLVDFPWNRYVISDSSELLLFFGTLQLLHLDASCFVIEIRTLLDIVIFNLRINRTLIVIFFVFNCIFPHNLGINNWTSDHHNLWI